MITFAIDLSWLFVGLSLFQVGRMLKPFAKVEAYAAWTVGAMIYVSIFMKVATVYANVQ